MRTKHWDKLTPSNIDLYAHRLRKFLATHKRIKTQGDWGAVPKRANRLGLSHILGLPYTEKTVAKIFWEHMVEIKVERNLIGTYIWIGNSESCFGVFHLGDKIKTTPCHVFVRGLKNGGLGTLLTTWCPYQGADVFAAMEKRKKSIQLARAEMLNSSINTIK